MKLKSYFAATVEAAMNMARLEMGADAMLVSTRRTDEQSRHLGDYEVVFASMSSNDARSLATPPATSLATSLAGGAQSQSSANILPLRAPPPLAKTIGKLSEEVAGLKREMERFTSALSRSTAGNAKIAANAELAEAFSKLVDAEMDAGLAQDILWRVTSEIDSGPLLSPSPTSSLIVAELSRLLNVDSRLAGNAGRNAIAVVGPPGSGKTTTLVKLAVLYGLGTRRPSQIISLDTHRVAGTEQLRSYAAITGIGFQALETPRALAQALEEHRNKDLIFIDTPGFAHNDLEDAAGMAALISKEPHIETHLVLSASMKPADMKRIALQYEMFAPSKLIFTHLDETRTFGPLLSLAIKTGKPVSFISRGQQVPEDLEPAARHALVDLVIRASPLCGEEAVSACEDSSCDELISTAAA
jgi:flagellar biosynthesis protein FlhF